MVNGAGIGFFSILVLPKIKRKTCGLLMGEGNAECCQFGEAKNKIIEFIKSKSLVNLVIEAPLSVCFSTTGNPAGRKNETKKGKTRYWYIGPGCAVMTAARYIVRDIYEHCNQADVKLFEGFITFKESDKKTNHIADVLALRDVIKRKRSDQIFNPEPLNPDDKLSSAFLVSGMDCGIPVIISGEK